MRQEGAEIDPPWGGDKAEWIEFVDTMSSEHIPRDLWEESLPEEWHDELLERYELENNILYLEEAKTIGGLLVVGWHEPTEQPVISANGTETLLEDIEDFDHESDAEEEIWASVADLFDPKEFSGDELELYNPRQPRDKGGKWTKGGGGTLEAKVPSDISGVSPANLKKMKALEAHATGNQLLVPLSLKPDDRKKLQKEYPDLVVTPVNASKLLKGGGAGKAPKKGGAGGAGKAPKKGGAVGAIKDVTNPDAGARAQNLVNAGFTAGNANKISLINGPITNATTEILVPKSIKPAELQALKNQFPGKTIKPVNAAALIKKQGGSPKVPPIKKTTKGASGDSGFGKKSKPTKGTKPKGPLKDQDVKPAGDKCLEKTKNKWEYAVCLDEKGNVVGEAFGKKNCVNIANIKGIKDPPPRITVVHNHPNNSSLSPADFVCVGSYQGLPGAKEIVAVGKDGSLFRGRGKGSPQLIKKTIKANDAVMYKVAKEQGINFKYNQSAWQLATHLVNEAVAKTGVTEYKGKLGSDGKYAQKKWPAFETALRKALGL